MTENNLCHPTTVFFLLIAGVFILSAILHPKEFTNLFKGFTYYLAIPTMYMTLMIYSMCNLHDVSWGTREGSTNQNGENGAAKKGEAEKKTDVLSSIKIHTSSAVDRALRCSGCCTFNCCSQPIELNELTTNVMKLSKQIDEMRQLTTASTEPEPGKSYNLFIPTNEEHDLMLSPLVLCLVLMLFLLFILFLLHLFFVV